MLKLGSNASRARELDSIVVNDAAGDGINVCIIAQAIAASAAVAAARSREHSRKRGL